ncbi:MAG: glycosyltransferase family 2 protein [Desulfobacteraceae bacterium]|nr:glycosyltransferase family 2 protein [Desulfobacteraceae bacterium]MBC2720379.1 glycosyltransferase family 2 protein [Desulfobacteraceae bacterium]
MTKFMFWFSMFAIFYAYLGYPIALSIIALFKPKQLNKPNKPKQPMVSLLISAYNEEGIIKKKLKNALSLDYPANKLEIIVISDASEDKTDEYVKGFFGKGVRLLRQEIRQGKTTALNMAVSQACGEIIVFSDANSMYDRSAIKNLVKNFKDPVIGFVTGRTKYISRQGSSATESTSFYNKLERFVKRLESKIGSCVGADGAIFAIRKELYKTLKSYDINDFVIPLKIIEQGYRGILENEAFCIEETARDIEGEFNRQVRITNRTIRAMVNNKALLNPIKFPLFSIELVSHKIIKFMLPFFMVIVFVTNCFLVATDFFYSLILALQVLFYILAYWGYIDKQAQNKNRLTSMPYTFNMVSLAILLGWIKYFSGETYTTWTSERV